MRNFLKKVRQKWTYSIVGLWTAFREEKSLWAYLLIVPILIGVGVWIELSLAQWSVVSIIIFLVFSIEIINTALEAAVDTISFEYNVKVKKIKDIAAAATLIITLGAMVSLFLIYIPGIIDRV